MEESIRSALSQDYKHLEIVVSDDASTDGTSRVLARYSDDSRVRVYINPINLGRVANYRQGLYERARGDYVLNLDGDDYLTDSHFISAAVEALGYCSSAALVFGRRVSLMSGVYHSKASSDGRIEVIDGSRLFMELATGNVEIHHMAALYNRRTAMEIGFYRANIASSDRESLYRLVLNRKAIRIDRVAGVWRSHEGNYSRLVELNKLFSNYESVVGPYREATEKTRIPKAELRRWYSIMVARRLRVDLKLLARACSLRLAPALLTYVMSLSPRAVLRVVGNPKNLIMLASLRLGLSL